MPLESLNTDLCGPINPKTIHGEKYTSIFIDQASRYIFGKLLKSKDAAVLHLNELTSELDNQRRDSRISNIYSDGGGEYTSATFKAACTSRGISQKFTNADTPEENHLAEKTNEYVFNKVRVYMTLSGLPATLWGYCFNYVVYVYNNTPQELLNQRTPYEVLHNKPSRLYMLKTFGSLAYMHVPKKERKSKLSNPAIPCVFVGYAADKLSYLLYEPKSRTIVTSRSVKFDESKIKNAHLFTNDDFKSGRLTIPSKISTDNVNSNDDLANARFKNVQDDISPSDEEKPAVRTGQSKSSISSDDEGEAALSDDEDESATSKVHQEESPRALDEEKLTLKRPRGPPCELRPRRKTKRPRRYEVNQICHEIKITVKEPQTFSDVDKSEHRAEWIKATNEEFQAMMSNDVWDLVELPPHRKALKSKWVWKIKYAHDGTLERFKARLVIKGYLQIAGVDFVDTFAPVLRLESLRVLCALIAILDLDTIQLDIKTAFLNGDLEEEIYMVQPERYQVEGKTHLVCKLKKALYGLKQAPRQWHKKLHKFLIQLGFKQCHKEQCIYVFTDKKTNTIIYLAVYVDDIVIAGKNKQTMNKIKMQIQEKFEVSDKGELTYLLGIKIDRDRSTKTLRMNQAKFVNDLLVKFQMEGCDSEPTPQVQGLPAESKQTEEDINLPYRSLVGALQYLVSATRPDIAFAVRFLSSHNHDYTKAHWKMAKRVLKYLKGTLTLGLQYGGNVSATPVAYSDADFANDKEDSKSISGSIVMLGGAAITYMSKKQSLVGQSTTEVEFIAAAETAKNVVWLYELLDEMKVTIQLPIVMYVDNQSAIQVAKAAATHSRTKHIRLRYHFLKDLVSEGVIDLKHINTKKQLADVLTKVQIRAMFKEQITNIGLC